MISIGVLVTSGIILLGFLFILIIGIAGLYED